MNKNKIKIIKRFKETDAENITNPSRKSRQSAKAKINTQREMIDVVNGWIDERGANRRDEEFASLGELLNWKTNFDDSEENLILLHTQEEVKP
jgi:hypothetical protein